MNAPFWQLEQHDPRAIALLCGDDAVTYGELAALADAAAKRLPPGRTLGFLTMCNRVDSVALYLGALRSGSHVPLLLQADMDETLRNQLVSSYQPDWIALPAAVACPAGYKAIKPTSADDAALSISLRNDGSHNPPLHPALALLLNTSGSTGSSKLVRHSSSAIAANAVSIVEYLGLRPDDRAITTLPLAYSFGMSILNSHLLAGASLVLTNHTMVNREFWDLARRSGITSLSGVPATYEMLRRLKLAQQGLSSLRMLTQAGGRLRNALIEEFAAVAQRLDLSFFVMYGQTEAAPRISYVPPARLLEKVGSIGISVPGGQVTTDADTGELIYRGANVMLGYAESRPDLALGDVLHGTLHTGDLVRIDDDGYAWLIGRTKRFIKISGKRINLDEVEALLASELGSFYACSGDDDDLVVFVATGEMTDAVASKHLLAQRYKLLPGHIRSIALNELPLLGTGKVDYTALRAMAKREGES